jgi:hypothetical protein
MRVLLALSLLLFACDKIAPGAQEDAGAQEINVELEQEAQELDKLGVERDMLDTKVQITKEELGAAESQLEDAKTSEQKTAARANRDKAKLAYKAAEAALLHFKHKQAAR